jgi:hypothetical protein
MEGMHTLNFDILARLDASAVRSHAVSKAPVISCCGGEVSRASYCLGAVVFTFHVSAASPNFTV